MPDFTPPAPYALEDNEDSLLDHSDLVFINPVGTGYSAAIAPGKNQDFWGVDEDARCIKQFIRRYLTTYNRWNSPKFLFGESYGTPRTCVLTWFLHEDGIDLNGVVLQSCALDFSQNSNPIGLIPTLAADAWFHKKVTLQPAPSDLPSFMKEVEKFARERYAKARESFPKIDPDTLQYLSDILGIPSVVLKYWKLDPSASSGSIYLASLLLDEGLDVGAFDGRVTAINTGIVASIDPGNKDPTMTAIGGVYTTMWNVYLNQELQYISTSPFINLNDQVFPSWNFAHMDPTGVQKGGIERLYTAGDLAAAMALNPYLKVFSANGYYDAMTPFFRAKLDFENMPLSNAQVRDNIKMHQYPSGHMVYLDNRCRSAMKSDLASFYKDSTVHSLSMTAFKAEERRRAELLRYCRRINRTPY
jgi:carboxypeptidase C (cathepsin A)